LLGFHSFSFVIVPKRRRGGCGLVRNIVFLGGEEHSRAKGVVGKNWDAKKANCGSGSC